MLDNLKPAPRVESKSKYKPGIEFDGTEGTATTPGYESEPENFDTFLIDAGLDPDGIEVIPPVRTSRWQQQKDGELVWLTSYRFTFRRKAAGLNLPLLLAEANKKVKLTPLKASSDKALVVLWSDLQVGKVDYRGNSESLIERVGLMQQRITALIKREKPKKVIFADLGDTVENFTNAANMQQLQSNDLSIMEQVDLATTFAWQTLKQIVALVPDVTYASIGSNHCQWRVGGQTVGKATDDWAVFIGRQLARMAGELELPIKFLEPQPHDESLALDVFGDGFHILGLVHGHQVQRPEGIGDWWRKQAFGRQPVSDATILCHGHFHHLRVTEMGSTPQGSSRFVVMGATLDNGSGWFKKRSGEDSVPGLVTFLLERGIDFTGTVYKL
jgi:hypothetical protein